MLTDTHAHLYWDEFQEDFKEVLQRAKDAGVTNIINVGVDIEKSEIALKQVRDFPEGFLVRSTMGIHPHEAYKYTTDESIHKDIAKLEQLYLSAPDMVTAIGECGLDFAFSGNPDFIPTSLSIDKIKNLQIKLLQAQIDLAKKLNLPLLVHVRDDRSEDLENSDAWDKILEMIADYPTLLHCYSGLPKTTETVLKNPNLIISFAATLTYPRNDYLKEAAKLIPLERIVLETDCPFLPPQSKRGTRNEPANVAEIAKLLSEIKNVTLEEVADQTTKNAFVFFKISV